MESLKFVVGGVVRLIGLRRAEFNDQRGTVVTSVGEKEDRVSVQLENTKKVLLVKRENLLRETTERKILVPMSILRE